MEQESSDERVVTHPMNGATIRQRISPEWSDGNPYGGLDQAGRDHTIKVQEGVGDVDIVQGGPGLILLDLDGEYPLEMLKDLIDQITRFNQVMGGAQILHIADYWVSRSGTGLHAKVGCPECCTWQERSLIAMHLGSDPIREFLSLARWKNGIEEPWLLFKPKKPVEPNQRSEFEDDIPF